MRALPDADVVTANLTGALLVRSAGALLIAAAKSGRHADPQRHPRARTRRAWPPAFAPATVVWERQAEGWVGLAMKKLMTVKRADADRLTQSNKEAWFAGRPRRIRCRHRARRPRGRRGAQQTRAASRSKRLDRSQQRATRPRKRRTRRRRPPDASPGA